MRRFLPFFLLLAACKPNIDAPAPSANGVDFSRYVAVGNSLTAGFASGSLTRYGQENSYPSILARQFKIVGGGDFKQPLLNSNWGYPGPVRTLGYVTDCKGVTAPAPVAGALPVDTAGSAANVAAQGPFNNTGVPGIRVINMLQPGYAGFNPYSARFFAEPGLPPIREITRIPATVFTMWLGSNDVLAYATDGGEGEIISPLEPFKISYDSCVAAMTAGGAKGVLINIPDITAIPYFTTIPYNGLSLSATDAAKLTATYPAGFEFHEGVGNRFVIQDKVTGGPRQIMAGELLLLTLPQDSLKCGGWGTITPIPSRYVLDAAEVANCQSATAIFNAHILQRAQEYGLAHVDMNTYLRSFTSGITFNGVEFSTRFVTGGTFSLDGIHLTPRGYAIVANKIIQGINAKYNASVPEADVNAYDGVLFP